MILQWFNRWLLFKFNHLAPAVFPCQFESQPWQPWQNQRVGQKSGWKPLAWPCSTVGKERKINCCSVLICGKMNNPSLVYHCIWGAIPMENFHPILQVEHKGYLHLGFSSGRCSRPRSWRPSCWCLCPQPGGCAGKLGFPEKLAVCVVLNMIKAVINLVGELGVWISSPCW